MTLSSQFPENLTERDKSVLDFESANPGRISGRKADKIRETFGANHVNKYAQHLNHVVDHPQAIVYASDTVARVIGARDKARKARGG